MRAPPPWEYAGNYFLSLESNLLQQKNQPILQEYKKSPHDADGNEEVRYDNNNMSKSILVRPQYGLDISVTDSSNVSSSKTYPTPLP